MVNRISIIALLMGTLNINATGDMIDVVSRDMERELNSRIGQYQIYSIANPANSLKSVSLLMDSADGRVRRITESNTLELVKMELPYLLYCKAYRYGGQWQFRSLQTNEMEIINLFDQIKVPAVSYKSAPLEKVVQDMNSFIEKYCKEKDIKVRPKIVANLSTNRVDDCPPLTFSVSYIPFHEFLDLVVDVCGCIQWQISSNREVVISGRDEIFTDAIVYEYLPGRFKMDNSILIDSVTGVMWRYDFDKNIFRLIEEKNQSAEKQAK